MSVFGKFRRKRRWKKNTLVIGPSEPVDGDSLGCTIALIRHLRKQGKTAYTLPTLTMFPQLEWMLSEDDLHPACRQHCSPEYTTDDLQSAYNLVRGSWCPDEIVLLDGQVGRLGFDPGSVPVYTIDHHVQLGTCDDKSAYIQPAPATGCLLVDEFGVVEPILAVSIFTDTWWLRENMPADAIGSLNTLYKRGGLTNELLCEYQQKIQVRKDPAVLDALLNCERHVKGNTVLAIMKDSDPNIHRGILCELGEYYSHLCVVRGDGYASLRSKDRVANLAQLGARFGGGGHKGKAVARLSLDDRTRLFDFWRQFLLEVGEVA